MSKKVLAVLMSVAALGGGFSALAGTAYAGDDNHPHQLNPHHK
jgi:hypothetical protein